MQRKPGANDNIGGTGYITLRFHDQIFFTNSGRFGVMIASRIEEIVVKLTSFNLNS